MTGEPANRIVVVRPGPQSLIQDLGRPGLAHLGVGASGAMDRASLALGNRLTGNSPDAAGLEILFGGIELAVTHPTWFAITGARGEARVGGRGVQADTATLADAGDSIFLGAAESGIRYYLAVRGGICVSPVLGSRSRDTLASLGPRPLSEGDELPLGAEPTEPVPAVDIVPVDAPTTHAVTIAVRPGPRRGWFDAASWDALVDTQWRVSPRSDRSGIRLEGQELRRTNPRELPSEGMIPGAIQVSPDGAPTILAVDHPVTGGYPVIAVVTDDSLDSLAQVRPGQGIRFRIATGRS